MLPSTVAKKKMPKIGHEKREKLLDVECRVALGSSLSSEEEEEEEDEKQQTARVANR